MSLDLDGRSNDDELALDPIDFSDDEMLEAGDARLRAPGSIGVWLPRRRLAVALLLLFAVALLAGPTMFDFGRAEADADDLGGTSTAALVDAGSRGGGAARSSANASQFQPSGHVVASIIRTSVDKTTAALLSDGTLLPPPERVVIVPDEFSAHVLPSQLVVAVEGSTDVVHNTTLAYDAYVEGPDFLTAEIRPHPFFPWIHHVFFTPVRTGTYLLHVRVYPVLQMTSENCNGHYQHFVVAIDVTQVSVWPFELRRPCGAGDENAFASAPGVLHPVECGLPKVRRGSPFPKLDEKPTAGGGPSTWSPPADLCSTPLRDEWYYEPLSSCTPRAFGFQDERILDCLSGSNLLIVGDSTMRQWVADLQELLLGIQGVFEKSIVAPGCTPFVDKPGKDILGFRCTNVGPTKATLTYLRRDFVAELGTADSWLTITSTSSKPYDGLLVSVGAHSLFGYVRQHFTQNPQTVIRHRFDTYRKMLEAMRTALPDIPIVYRTTYGNHPDKQFCKSDASNALANEVIRAVVQSMPELRISVVHTHEASLLRKSCCDSVHYWMCSASRQFLNLALNALCPA